MKKARTSLFLVVALGLFALYTVGLADEFVDKSAPLFCAVGWFGEFTHIDPSIGEVPPTRNDLPSTLQALAYSPEGILYAAAGNRYGLYKIDPWTGNAEYFLSTNVDIAGMAFSPSGELYVTGSSGARYLRTIDLNDGSSTSVGTLWGDRNSAQGLAFSPHGILYAIKPNVWLGTYELLTIDLDDAQMHLLGSYSSTANVNQSITFTADGRLYAIGRDAFAELNPTDGSLIGSYVTPSGDYRGLAIVPPMVYYVDADATGANDGSSWADAFNYLQDALTAAWSGDEIRVAQGTYTPDSNSADPNGSGDREATFQLINGVTIKGGYAGCGEPDPNARDIQLYETILSGDLDSNDVELDNLDWNTIYLFVGHPSRAENSCHVVTGSGTDETAVLDGVTITRGNAYGPEPGYCENKDGSLTCGAGMYNDSGSPTLTNCTFCRNTSWTIYAYSCPEDSFDAGIRDFDVSFDLTDIFMVDTSGAGIYNCNSNMTLNNCMFEENIVFGADSSSAGGGIHNVNSDIVLINCIFKTNVAAGFDSHYWGGAIANSNSNPTLEGCSFIENLAYYGGGGALTLSSDTNASLSNCTFVGNMAEDGGAISGLGQATLTNCTFHENVATFYGYGGAIYSGSGNPALVNCTFSNNSADKGGGIFHGYKGSATLINCVFTENSADGGAGIFSPSHYGTLIVRDCTFSANKAEGWGGGGMYNGSDGNSIVTNCVFIANSSERHGGGMYNWRSNTTSTNCTFRGNKAREYGGGMFNCGSSSMLTNCTFVGNSASDGKALACYSFWHDYPSYLQLTNCILWDGGDEIWNNDNSVISIAYSDIQNGWLGEGNIDADPCFVDPGCWDTNEVWIDGDYHLLIGSPCIDAGDPNYIAEPNERDLDGKPRIINGRIDMGAYEAPIMADARIVPRTISLASSGKWIAAFIRLPEDYNVADIDPNSIFLENEIKSEQFSVDEQSQVAVARFDREDVQAILDIGDVELTITGRLTDGTPFEATDVIRVLNKAGKKPQN